MNRPVLYVEDEEDDAVFMRIAWERLGMSCPLVVVTDGQHALDYIDGKNQFADREQFPSPQLVLLDLNLSPISGLEVLTTIRSRFDKLQLPVVIFTSSDSPRDKAATAEAGCNKYVIKPTGLKQLVETLSSIALLVQACRNREAIATPAN